MKHQQQIADIDSICLVVEQDWSSAVISRILTEGGKENLKDTVHAALGNMLPFKQNHIASPWNCNHCQAKTSHTEILQLISGKFFFFFL